MQWRERLRKHLQDPAAPDQPAGDPGLHIPSSVLIPIGWNRETSRDEILLTKRTMTVETHKGQVSFPGGMREAGDRTFLDTALREANEEIGTIASDIEILGPLKPVVTRGDVVIYPWVGFMTFPYPFRVNDQEVERLLVLPLASLLSQGLEPVEVEVGGGIKVKSIGIRVDDELVWGATAKMLQELRERFLTLQQSL